MIKSAQNTQISKVVNESTNLFSVLKQHFPTINVARLKLMSLFITTLCKVQTVNYEKLALAFDTGIAKESNLRRIQRFFASYVLNVDLIAKFIFSLLPKQDKYELTMDRTNWKFGKANINILVIGVVYKGVAFPLLFKMLDKFGNSSTDERIELMNRYDTLFGFNTVETLVADREFVGYKWLQYLKGKNIKYHIRIRENFYVCLPKNQDKKMKARHLFTDLKMGEFRHFKSTVIINDVECYLSASVIKSKQGLPEYQFLVSFDNPSESAEYYKRRWQIETMFKALKSSGFNIEDTHLTNHERIEKLLSLVFIAFIWCYTIGIYIDVNFKKVKIKKHGFRAKSLFKYGLEYVATVLLTSYNQHNINIFNFLSCS
jgi:hypothetical protein